MSLKGLNYFLKFDLQEFLKDKKMAYLKSSLWKDGETILGARVVGQIVEDNTRYTQPEVNNFGEQITIKVRGVAPSAFAQLRPLSTEVIITEVERATVYGDFHNQLSIIAKIAVKDAPAKQ